MRILVCSTGFMPAESFGGLPFSTFNLCRSLVRAGANVSVITTNTNGATSLDVRADCWTTYEGIPVWYAATGGGAFLYGASASGAIEASMAHADCVINSGTLWSHAGVVSWRAAARHRTPSVTYVRGLLDPWAFKFKGLRKRAYWHAIGKRILSASTAIVALSETERATIRNLNIDTRIEVIPNGASLEAEGEPRASLDARYPALAGRPYVLFLGRIHAKKGIDILLRAVAEYSRRDQHTAFVVAGPVDPGYAAEWARLLRLHGLRDVIVAPGSVSGALKTTFLKHAALFVLPSHGEGLPVAVLEALLSGCPVVITPGCNLPEVAAAGAGIQIAPEASQLVDAMRAILPDAGRRGRMSERARVLACTRFDWQAIGARTLALCEEILSTPRAQDSPSESV